MLVPNNSLEQAPNLRQSVPSKQRDDSPCLQPESRGFTHQRPKQSQQREDPCSLHPRPTSTLAHPSPLLPEGKLEGRKVAANSKLKSRGP